MEVKLLELFAGIGGFAKGIQDAGHTITNHYFSEIDKHCIANYKYNFKNAEYIGSVQDMGGRRITPDIITFGSPCQDFSVAGKQRGMDGQRSVLILQAIEIVRQYRPGVFIWENVKGMFSSNAGADFWAILAAFAHLGGYRLEWQLCNTNWFLPQNRERIYLVGHRDGRSTPGIFPLGKADSIHHEKNKGKKSGIANCLDANYQKGWLDKGQRTHIVKTLQGKQKTNTIRASGKSSFTPTKAFDIIKTENIDNEADTKPPIQVAKKRRTEEAKQIRRESMKNGRDYNPCQSYNTNFEESKFANTITCQSPHDKVIKTKDMTIRKLTEIECERLQGFPDDWTKYGNYAGEIKKIGRWQRYKMLGNAATTNVVRAIAERLSIYS